MKQISSAAKKIVEAVVFVLSAVLIVIMFTVCAILLSENAKAEDVAQVPYRVIGEVRSDEGMSMENFLSRVGLQLRQFSDETGTEACGMIAADAHNHYALTMTTNDSHAGCVQHHNAIPAGFDSIGLGIHSHGNGKPFMLNAADRMLLHLPANSPAKLMHDSKVDMFSADDYLNGAGYLATRKGVIYQEGKDKVSTIVSAY